MCQLTVPSEAHGVITARRKPEHSLSSLIASTQRYASNQTTFGLKLVSISKPGVSSKPEVERGPLIERGSFNYRWPFHEYALRQSDSQFEAGTYALFSFIREGALYQVMRLERDCRRACIAFDFPATSKIRLEFGVPECFTAFPGREEVSAHVKFEAHIYLIGTGEPELIKKIPEPHDPDNPSKASSTLNEAFDVNIDRSGSKTGSDSVIFLLAMRAYEPGADKASLERLTSEDIFDWVGADPLSSWATGAMWETIFFRREDETNCVSELSEVNLVARCLQRVLHVDLVPQGLKVEGKKRPLALLSNIILGAELDMQALL